MLSQIKLCLAGAAVLIAGGLLAALKIQSKRLDSVKKKLATQKVHTEAAQEAAVAIQESKEVVEEAVKIHEKVSATSASDDRDWLLNKYYKDDSGTQD